MGRVHLMGIKQSISKKYTFTTSKSVHNTNITNKTVECCIYTKGKQVQLNFRCKKPFDGYKVPTKSEMGF